ncbi:6775_t:CDS:2, partial [Dentiscutata erythropus]
MKPKKFHYISSVPYFDMGQTLNTSSLLSNFNAYNHDQINSSLSSQFNINEQDTTSDFSPPCFNTYELDNANAFLPYFSYEHNITNTSVRSTYINIQSFSNMLAGSDVEAQSEARGFSFRKRRRVVDSDDHTITRRRIYECLHAWIREPEKTILAEDRRDRDSEMIDCSWHINLAFSKTEKDVRINSILGKHNHKMNALVTEMAPKYRKLTYEMSKKVKFWTIHRKLGLPTQYN